MEPDSRTEKYRQLCSRATLQDQKEGFFFTLAETLSENLDLNLFAKFTTDFERVKYVAALGWNAIGAQLIYRGKKPEDADATKREGDKFLETKDYHKAMLCYCRSIVQASPGEKLAEVYNQRSKLLEAQGDHELSISDSELAISYGISEESRSKIYERMASCYVAIKNYHKAKVILRLAKHFSEKHHQNDTEFSKKLEKLEKDIDQHMDKGKSKSKSKNVPTASNKNSDTGNFKPGKKFKNASDQVDVKHSAGLGRYVYASKNINVGDEIIREEPFAVCLSPTKLGTHCLHCLKRLKAPIACDVCANVAFCSRDCKKLADPYHQHECRIMSMLIGSGMSLNCYLALRIITRTPIEEWLKVIPSLNIDPQGVLTNPDGTYDTSYRSIYNLGGLEEQRPPEEMLHRAIMSVFLVKCLRLTGYFNINLYKTPLPSSAELNIAALILRNLQVIQFNAYEVCEFLMGDKTDYKSSKALSLGLAIYSTSSFLNHSCSPDVTRFFKGTTLIVKAIKNIKPNQPIYDNYGPHFAKKNRDDRRLQLKGRYWFHCVCEACENNWETLSNMKDEIQARNAEETAVLLKLKQLDPLFHKSTIMMEKGQPEKAIGLLCEYIHKSENLLAPFKDSPLYPNKTTVLALQAIQLCYCSLGTVHLSPLGKGDTKQ